MYEVREAIVFDVYNQETGAHAGRYSSLKNAQGYVDNINRHFLQIKRRLHDEY